MAENAASPTASTQITPKQGDSKCPGVLLQELPRPGNLKQRNKRSAVSVKLRNEVQPKSGTSVFNPGCTH